MNILVTGGAGYIGSHAVRRLLREGHRVVVLDNLSRGYSRAIEAASSGLGRKAELVRASVGDKEAVIRALKEHAIEAVMHFAALIEVGESVTEPSIYYRNNFADALSLLDAMTASGVRRLVFSSTAAVYGNPVSVPITEDQLRSPINPYGRSKMMVELALEDYAAAYGLGYATLRYFNVAGADPEAVIGEAHEPESHLIPRVLEAAAGHSPAIGIFGDDYPTRDGTCVRDYIHVEDLVSAHVLALAAIQPGRGLVYNLGSESGFSVREVIEACSRVVGGEIPVKAMPRRAGDPATLVASSAKIRQELGWERKHPELESMIRHAWAWYQGQARSWRANRLLRACLEPGPQAERALRSAQVLLELDDLNWSYFLFLFQRKIGGAAPKRYWIHEEGKEEPAGRHVVYPTAIAPPALLGHLRVVEHAELGRSSEDYAKAARGAALWVKKMQAGSGSSMTRATYLSRVLGIPLEAARIGAKGTDLFVEVPDPLKRERKVRISLAEAQLIQSVLELKHGKIGQVVFHDIVSSETEASIAELWNKPSFLDPAKSYDELARETPNLSRFGKTYQRFIPTLDESGEVSFRRQAPGGHALFAVDALRAAYLEELRPRTSGRPLVAAISNGEDLSSAPDRLMIGYLVRNQVPIALVTTEKTQVDVKGGAISLLRDSEGGVSLTVLETAQAKEAGQQRLFESLGGVANTNLALFNYEVLAPLISREVREIGEDEFLRIISPDLISNTKEQADADGVTRKYVQLEGAMGSTLMNLDRYWRLKHGGPLVHLINVDRMHRTDFFSPIKSAFDYFMQFHSDRFRLDPTTMRLKNLRPGELPLVTLSDPITKDRHYQDVENVLQAFEGASIRELDELTIEGQAILRGATLKGCVRIVNRLSTPLDLSGQFLENTVREAGTENRLTA